MKLWRFVLFTFLGSGIWNAVLILGGQWLAKYEAWLEPIVIGTMVLAVAGYIWRVLTWKPRV